MKDSITAAQSVDFGYIQGAWRRIEAMRSSEADPVEPPTLSELEEPDLSNPTCARRFRPRKTAGHGDGRDTSVPV